MANVNNIMNLINMVAANMGTVQQDTMSEFTEKVDKQDLVKQNKKSTNAKWMAWDIATSIGGMVINQYRQRQFEKLQENAEAEADKQLKEREQKLNTLKENLGISALEEHNKKQDEVMEEILKSLKHLNAVARRIEEEKESKKADNQVKKYLAKATNNNDEEKVSYLN